MNVELMGSMGSYALMGLLLTFAFGALIAFGRCEAHMAAALSIEFGQNGAARITYEQNSSGKLLPCICTPLRTLWPATATKKKPFK